MALQNSASPAFLLCLSPLLFTLTNCDELSHLDGIPAPPLGSENFSGSPTKPGTCPRDLVKIKACVGVLNTIDLRNGHRPEACCSLIDGLVDLEAAVCVCTAIDLLGIIIDIDLTLVLNACGRNPPRGFNCPNTSAIPKLNN